MFSEKVESVSLKAENYGKPHQAMSMVTVKDDLPSMVDVVGYVDPNKRIKQMIEAGIRIDAWNHAVYDYENEDQDDGFSMAPERDDLDDIDMLSAAAREKELYYNEMYKLYSKALASQGKPNSGVTENNGDGEENGQSGESEKTQQEPPG